LDGGAVSFARQVEIALASGLRFLHEAVQYVHGFGETGDVEDSILASGVDSDFHYSLTDLRHGAEIGGRVAGLHEL
jgi:hypothetical protein